MNTTQNAAAAAGAAADAGPGTLSKAFTVMRLLAAAGRPGVSLTDLAKGTGLPHPTVHRLLRRLQDERAVRQLADTRRYALGSLVFELGLAAGEQIDIRAVCRPLLERLALAAGDTAFLSMRSGDESVCLDLCEGPSVIRVVTLQAGSRRPLGAGAGGLAILGALAAPQRLAVLARVLPLLEQAWGLKPKEIHASLAAFDRHGHAFIRNRVHAGVSAVGVPVVDSLGQAVGALSIAAINERMKDAQVGALAAQLKAAARELRRCLRAVDG